ncbi:MAG: ATP-dependent DNA helicase RecG [Bdellovibrionales bacterium]|nr:ATP-dependent DNA helicase RecG [Bdellovibrionales bacterium]
MAVNFETDVQYLKGVGPKLGSVFAKRGVYTVGDLLEWYPRTYEDRRGAKTISSLEPGQLVSLVAQVVNVRSMNLGKSRRKMYEILLGDSSGRIACKYFRVPYRGYFERVEAGMKVRVSGKVTDYRGRIEFHHPDVHPHREDENEEDVLIPIYTETEGLTPAKLRKIIETALIELDKTEKGFASGASQETEWKKSPKSQAEVLPKWLRDKYQLPTKMQSLSQIHQPPVQQSDLFLSFTSPAQRRLIFEEFFRLEFLMAFRKKGLEKEESVRVQADEKLKAKFLKSLPFELTGAQIRAYEEIKKDMSLPHPMHRLVQGDVGSGKTMVAFLSALYAIEAGFQAALMVPTEILAEQHFKNAVKLLQPMGIEPVLLTGSMKAKERALLNHRVSTGEAQFIVGTHALIQDSVNYHNLGLVVIDEQHRFGVAQRTQLKKKGVSPHFLVMTATPIPRTLAMTVYGDLDVSIINEMPKGRQPIVTRKAFSNKKVQVFNFLEAQLEKGRQAYVVYPLVEESDKMDLQDATKAFAKIGERFPKYSVALLHGKMKPDEKEKVMKEFRAGQHHILVATTVIEVGVDVPNANIMVIENAERFGLSQLHQLRGRVGRGEHKSFCVLLYGHAVSDESRARGDIMEKTNDGFKIAEADLELRGPGEFLGRRQSGLAGFKMANLIRDIETLKQARDAAFEVFEKDPDLKEHQQLKSLIRSLEFLG